MPGGSFFFGDPKLRGRTSSDISSERLVYLSPFFIDSTEVTVGALRKVLGAVGEDAVWRWTPTERESPRRYCNWTVAEGQGNEGSVVNCIAWETARAYCLQVGKDLPTEAQLEYVSSGLGEEWAFPWGNTEPSCREAVWGRAGVPDTAFPNAPGACRSSELGGPETPMNGQTGDIVDSNVLRNAGGISVFDLGGNVAEWARDTWSEPDGAYWRSTRLMVDPISTEPSRLFTSRGGAWTGSALTTRAGIRQSRTGNDPVVGFRCARSDLGD